MRDRLNRSIRRLIVWSGLIGLVALAALLGVTGWSRFQERVRAFAAIDEAGELYLTFSGPSWIRALIQIDGISITDRAESIVLIADENIDALMEAVRKCRGLEYLTLSSESLTDEHLAQIRGLRRLRQLELSVGEHVTDKGIAHLGRLSELRELSLHAENLTAEGVRHLSALTRLERVELWGLRLTEDALNSLKACPELRQLSWRGWGDISESGLETIAIAFPKLEELDLSNVPPHVTARGLSALQRLVHLRVLRLGGVHLNGEQMRIAGALHSLEELSLKSATLAEDGFVHFRNLQRLRVLDLSDVEGVTDEAVVHLSALPNLRHLDLTGTGITDQCVESLNQLIGLVELSVQGTELTDIGLKVLQSLAHLRRLNLSYTQVTDAGVKGLRSQFPRIEIISLQGTNVSPELQEKLIFLPDYHRRFE